MSFLLGRYAEHELLRTGWLIQLLVYCRYEEMRLEGPDGLGSIGISWVPYSSIALHTTQILVHARGRETRRCKSKKKKIWKIPEMKSNERIQRGTEKQKLWIYFPVRTVKGDFIFSCVPVRCVYYICCAHLCTVQNVGASLLKISKKEWILTVNYCVLTWMVISNKKIQKFQLN